MRFFNLLTQAGNVLRKHCLFVLNIFLMFKNTIGIGRKFPNLDRPLRIQKYNTIIDE